MARQLLIEADGGSRGNPGQAGSGSVVIDPATGEVLAEIGRYLGVVSNNVAEYTALIEGVRRALAIDPDAELHIRMDSKLVVEQMSGRWKIKHPDMAELAAIARELLTGTPVRFEWIPRERNKRADAAANRAMDLRADFDG
ncbi:MAG: reverse transcriptase-like protein [Cryobacterium sp.]|jgi:ribonuclease HI|nr:reverse transcriptase-like protein [Cryobacterium sp.]